MHSILHEAETEKRNLKTVLFRLNLWRHSSRHKQSVVGSI